MHFHGESSAFISLRTARQHLEKSRAQIVKQNVLKNHTTVRHRYLTTKPMCFRTAELVCLLHSISTRGLFCRKKKGGGIAIFGRVRS